jgi:Tfp pilus assembly protein PilE
MIKTIGLVGILCGAAIFGMSWARESFQTNEKAPTAILQAAATALELSHRSTGTYAGAKTQSVELVWADQFRYCIEFGGQHIAGPGGTPTAGDCAR